MPFQKENPAHRRRVADLLHTGRPQVPTRAVNTFMAVWNDVHKTTKDEGRAYASAHAVVNKRFPKEEAGHAANAAATLSVARMLAAAVGRRTLQELELTLQNCDCGKDHAGTLRVLQQAIRVASRVAGNPPAASRLRGYGGGHAASSVDPFANAEIKQVGARVDIVWKVFARDIYANGDKVFLAVREMLQNSRDAKAKNIQITWVPNDPDDEDSDGTLTFQDDGGGMSQATVENKFLVIGESGDEKRSGSDDTLGGFGAAKAAILTASKTEWSWEIHTRDVWVRSSAAGTYQTVRAPFFLNGTKVTLPGVRGGYAATPIGRGLPEQRIVALIACCDMRGLNVTVNGRMVASYFDGRRSRHGEQEQAYEAGAWGAFPPEVRSYTRSNKTGGAIIVRVKGLAQFAVGPPYGAELPRDWVLDFEIPKGMTPHSESYPFKAGRDAFRPGTNAYYAFDRMRDTIIVSAAKKDSDLGEYEEIQPDSTDPREQRASAKLNAMLDSVMSSDAFQATLADLAESSDEMNVAIQEALGRSGVTVTSMDVSDRPAGGKDGQVISVERVELNPVSTLLAELGTMELSEQVTRLEAFVVISLPDGDTSRFRAAIQRLADRRAYAIDLETFSEVLVSALRKSAPQVSDLVIGGSVSRILRYLESGVSASETAEVQQLRKKGRINHFGDAACIFIHRERFGVERGKEFQRKAKSYMKFLVAWDYTVRAVLAAANASVTNQWYRIERLGVGFVLDSEVLGLTRQDGKFVMVQPLAFEKIAEVYRDRPFVVAAWLHGVACHEIAHAMEMQGKGNNGHDQDWSIIRENLASETLFLLSVIEAACAKLLKLKKPRKRREIGASAGDVDARVARLESALAEARVQVDEAKAAEGQRTRLFDRYAGFAHKLHHLVGLYEFREWIQNNPAAVEGYGVTTAQVLGALDERDSGDQVVKLLDELDRAESRTRNAALRVYGSRYIYDAQNARVEASGTLGYEHFDPLYAEDRVEAHAACALPPRAPGPRRPGELVHAACGCPTSGASKHAACVLPPRQQPESHAAS